VSCPRNSMSFAAAQRVAIKMGRRLRCSWVTSRTILIPAGENPICRSAKWCGMRLLNASPARTALPAAHFDRNESHVIWGTGH
jgi:hypothetical protein